MNNQLNQLRTEIDTIDSQLLELLSRRFAVTRKVGQLKTQSKLPTVDPNRENQQMQRIAQLAQRENINPQLAQNILRTIIDEVVIEHQAIQSSYSASKITAPTIGIIGLGDFGMFIAKTLAKYAQVSCFDSQDSKTGASNYGASLKAVLQAEYIILAVPFEALNSTLLSIKSYLKPTSTIIDVCTVKIHSEKAIRKILPNHKNVVFTHPLFGPQSANKQLAGHTIVCTNSNTAASKKVLSFCHSVLGLRLVAMSAREHDMAMAEIHALTLFVARGLNLTGITKGEFQTPSFQMLLDLIALDTSQSEELFRTVELANPFAAGVRNTFLTQLHSLNTKLNA